MRSTTLAGRLKKSSWLEVYDKDASFEPRLDPIVRVEAGGLRLRLLEYYAEARDEDSIIIEIPRGGYIPSFRGALGFRDEPPRPGEALRQPSPIAPRPPPWPRSASPPRGPAPPAPVPAPRPARPSAVPTRAAAPIRHSPL